MIIYCYPTIAFKQGRIHLIEERWQLGEISFNNFWTAAGFHGFCEILKNEPELLEDITIIDERSRKYTPQEFVDKISKLNIIA